jgi:hypothetical protein
MANLRRISLVALLLTAWGLAGADTLQMDRSFSPENDGRPARGMTQASVESKYGEPATRRAPVGDPPIARWEYADFVVYFEYDKVIHTVRKR